MDQSHRAGPWGARCRRRQKAPMRNIAIASVPYVNGYPLVRDLWKRKTGLVEVLFELPAAFPQCRFWRSRCHLVSSIDGLRNPGRRMGPHCLHRLPRPGRKRSTF